MHEHARAATTALTLALGLAACGDATAPVRDGTDVTAAGRVYTLDGGMPPGLTVTLAAGTHRTSAPVSGDGSFSISARMPDGAFDLILDVDSRPRTTHPSLLRLNTRTTLPDLRFVLVPTRWEIERGSHAGTTVAISLDAAFRPPCTRTGDTNCDGFYPTAWLAGIKHWPESALPIRVAFDHARTMEAIGAADSVAFWDIIHRMNDAVGTPLFRAARADEITVVSDRPQDAVLVRVDTTLAGFGAWTNWWWDAGGNIYSGVVRPRSASLLSSSSLMTHELLHTNGFKHSCSWSTVMGGYGCGAAAGLSAHDVAYAHVASRVRAVQRQTGAVHGLAASLDGQRIIALGLPRDTAASLQNSAALRSDGIGEELGDHAH